MSSRLRISIKKSESYLANRPRNSAITFNANNVLPSEVTYYSMAADAAWTGVRDHKLDTEAEVDVMAGGYTDFFPLNYMVHIPPLAGVPSMSDLDMSYQLVGKIESVDIVPEIDSWWWKYLEFLNPDELHLTAKDNVGFRENDVLVSIESAQFPSGGIDLTSSAPFDRNHTNEKDKYTAKRLLEQYVIDFPVNNPDFENEVEE